MAIKQLDWYSIIGHFPSLITLEGPPLLFGTKSTEANSEIIRTVLQLCPKMRRLSWFESEECVPSSYVVIIEREGKSVEWDVRWRSPDTEHAVDRTLAKGNFEL